MASARPVPWRLGHDGGRHCGSARYVLLRRGRWRRVEDQRRRHDLAADVGRTRRGADRCNCYRAIEAERDLCRQRSSRAALRHRGWRRPVQIHRRRSALATRRADRDAAYRRDPRRREESGHRAGRRAWSHLRPQSRARRVPHDRWRQELDEDAVHRRQHRRRRSRRRSRAAEYRFRCRMAGAQLAVAQLLHADRRRRQRDLPIAG